MQSMHIMNSTAQNSSDHKEAAMNEKIYKTMSRAGVTSLVLGIVAAVTGIVSGIMLIINGTKLLRKRSEITF